jgi:hypothetical protein
MLTILQRKPSAESWECSKNIRFDSSQTCHTKQDETIETTRKQCQCHTPWSSSSPSRHRQDKTRDKTRRDKGRHDEKRQDKTRRQGKTRQDKKKTSSRNEFSFVFRIIPSGQKIIIEKRNALPR